IELSECVVPMLGLDRRGDAGRYPEKAVPILLGVVVTVLVEHRQAHDSPPHVQRHIVGDLSDPAGGVPSPRAGGVEPEVHGPPRDYALGCRGSRAAHSVFSGLAVMPRSRVRVTVAATSNFGKAPRATCSNAV